jgi:hypothetical protein
MELLKHLEKHKSRTVSGGIKTATQFIGTGRTVVAMHDQMGDRPTEKRSGHNVASIMGVLFYPSVTDQSCSAVAEGLDPPYRVILRDGRCDSECFGGMGPTETIDCC